MIYLPLVLGVIVTIFFKHYLPEGKKYSSPFSWMVIDFKTALHFINNKFDTFTELVYKYDKQNLIISMIYYIKKTYVGKTFLKLLKKHIN